ncbi:acetyl-CoA carboxylase, carboxyl transferase, beta subunit [Chthoniobacter flavus Ellin428]|uniref:Acetyl-coenzyme A carboxylase carboxyl transferase subunit beta n=1 Tax=Chthoniobacter flavus Ellin428 TaxID=497964 RepID=B4CZE1_9BACT|nr:acetyl-CoA carboxylase, carboxyltransferase subunit beta [Chthoniobacter flavus]EDY20105.1 acetyl-CoA carboxylase, carboxyl transferase, beta subunit [Chthoniobacter flavus Ellin428]TCO94008.1 acetyl-CoA carboxylase carboxyl transferase subunit beta [Chthoniobacter flavus]
MGIFKKPPFNSDKKRDFPEGLWQKCPSCNEMIHNLELVQNFRVCPKCDHHFTQSARERLEMLLDPNTFEEHDAGMTSVDTLKFTGMASYTERLKSYQKKTGLKDAVISGLGQMDGQRLSISVMDFNFIAATMGSVVGEKLTRCVERATKERLPVIIVSASGGARMYEGVLSLLQMAKTCGALALHGQAGLPYISVLTHPTTGGVSASFATVGDVIVAEPKAMIGFAGPRVIRETTHQDLPPNFQTAEFLEDHGLVDMIVHRKKLRDTLSNLLGYLTPTK